MTHSGVPLLYSKEFSKGLVKNSFFFNNPRYLSPTQQSAGAFGPRSERHSILKSGGLLLRSKCKPSYPHRNAVIVHGSFEFPILVGLNDENE